ncbi:DUF1896 family protein [Prevotella sp. HUN102]|uniref:DUF1896 family protein n=1 Tax=Prevotella sp. HUN102 TaxID=1392486 RepID=UPI00048DCCE1|nr:DUF1896 family protein [Prevotella sp. HUN102]
MTVIHFSYYELSLLSFLRESHPELADDIPFVKERAETASQAYAEAFDNGISIAECIGIANKTLYAGLHFSRHDTISSVLWNEFSAEVPLEAVRETAIRLRPLLESIFAKYPISDEFAYMPEYNSLYTEITGFVQLKLEEDGKL